MSDVPSSEATGASRDNSEDTSNDLSTTSADLIDLRDSAGGDGVTRHEDVAGNNPSESLYASGGDGTAREDRAPDERRAMTEPGGTTPSAPLDPSAPLYPAAPLNPPTQVSPSTSATSSTPHTALPPAPTEAPHSVDASMAHPAGSATRAAAAAKEAAATDAADRALDSNDSNEGETTGDAAPVELPSDLPGTDSPSSIPSTSTPGTTLPGSDLVSTAADESAPVADAPTSIYDLLDQATTTSHPSSSRDLPRIIAVANQKGGVGKTTSTINMAACMADLGYRVLVVDFDPQANASTGLGLDPRSVEQSMYDVILRDTPIKDIMVQAGMENLWIAPSSLDLAGAEIELVPAFSRERKLANALDEIMPELDYVFIDCPPSLGLLTVNAFTAASEVLVPIQCEYYALEGLGQLLRNVELVQRNLNPGLEVSVIILVMFDGRTKLASQVVEEVRSHFGDKVAQQVVPRSVRLSEAPSYGQPIIAFDPKSRGAIAYRELAKEVSGGPANRTR